MPNKIKNFLKLIASILICEAVGIGGSLFTSPAVSSTWYNALEKPAWNPPSWVFSPVWITLYALMGIALFLVWISLSRASDGGLKRRIKIALIIFIIQLAFNFSWSIVFFGLQSPDLAFADIVLLWLAILVTIIAFSKISPPSSKIRTSEGRGKLAAWLLVPYILWVSFAACLNFSIWSLNRETGQDIMKQEAAARAVVEDFGRALKTENDYENFLDPKLLEKWEAEPKAMESLFSSPRPDRIEITSVKQFGSGAFEIRGNAIDAVGGRLVELSVVKFKENWLISGIIDVYAELMECMPRSDSASHEKCTELIKNIVNFRECIGAGFETTESDPAQCRTPDDRIFFKSYN